MRTDIPMPAKLARPLGKDSLSSSLAKALKIAELLAKLVFGIAVIGAVGGIPLSVAAARHWISTAVFEGPGSDADILSYWTVAVPYLLYGVIASGGALLIVRKLRAVFSSFVANQPFARDNATHLRSIWVTLIIIEIARILGWVLTHGLTAVFAASAKITFPSALEHPIDLVRLFLIFVVLILAEVFRQGAQLQQETELTV